MSFDMVAKLPVKKTSFLQTIGIRHEQASEGNSFTSVSLLLDTDSLSPARILDFLSLRGHLKCLSMSGFSITATNRVRAMASYVHLLLVLIAILSGFDTSECTNFTIVNKCQETVWPGITPGENFTNGNLVLRPGESSVVTPPAGWHGRIWGRTGCNFDSKGNDSTCQTGDCGALKCSGPGQSPATIAEFTLGELDYYDVSLVGGFNLPMVVTPLRGKGDCKTAGCDGDLRKSCPANLTVKDSGGKTIACQSACDAFNMDEYCCRGMYGNPVSCKATNYSTAFKQVCPVAYSYAYDDPTSIITCSASDYVVAFCASRNQTVCTYHNDKLVCNESRGAKILPHIWWILMLALSSMLD